MKKLTIITALYFCTAGLFAQVTPTDSVPPKPVTDTVTTAPPPAPAPTTTQEAPKEEKKKKMNCIRGGWQYSNLVGGDVESKNSFSSFYIGYNRKIKLISILKLETGVEYMMTGAEFESDTKIRMQYVGVPINLSVKLGPIYAIGGVTANWMVKQDIEVAGHSVDINDNNEANKFDWNAGLGLGVDILMFSVEARYYYGLSEVFDNAHNSYLQAGFRFNF